MAITNKKQIQERVDDFGESSHFVKVRVRGIFPSRSSLQFISRELVDEAMLREVHVERGEAACVGVDVARFGDDASVIRTRIGRDARSWPPIRLRGADTMIVAARVSEHVNLLRAGKHRVVLFVDGGGVGGGVVDKLRQLGHDVVEVQFGSKAIDAKRYANRRAEIYGLMKEWLATGAIEMDEALAADLTNVEYGFTPSDQILLERKSSMKARGLTSPDDADALAITFAQPVALPAPVQAARDAYARAAAIAGEPGWIGWVPFEAGPASKANRRQYDPCDTFRKGSCAACFTGKLENRILIRLNLWRSSLTVTNKISIRGNNLLTLSLFSDRNRVTSRTRDTSAIFFSEAMATPNGPCSARWNATARGSNRCQPTINRQLLRLRKLKA